MDQSQWQWFANQVKATHTQYNWGSYNEYEKAKAAAMPSITGDDGLDETLRALAANG